MAWLMMLKSEDAERPRAVARIRPFILSRQLYEVLSLRYNPARMIR